MDLLLTGRAPLLFDQPFGEGLDRQTHVTAASTVVPLGPGHVIAQDDSNFAAFWSGRSIMPVRVFPNDGEDHFEKARGNDDRKPDVEVGTALTEGDEPLVALLGSGSTRRRMRGALVRLTTAGPVATAADLTSLYDAIESVLSIGDDVINLEDACTLDGVVRLLQRGNAGAGGHMNATVDVDAAALLGALIDGRPIRPADITEVRRHDLGRMRGIPLGFSAADALADGRVVFAASAEDTQTSIDDGEVIGSVIGILERDGTVAATTPLPTDPGGTALKLEGLCVDSVDGRVASLRGVVDNDDPTTPSEALFFTLAI